MLRSLYRKAQELKGCEDFSHVHVSQSGPWAAVMISRPPKTSTMVGGYLEIDVALLKNLSTYIST
jgi:hypothetical protein